MAVGELQAKINRDVMAIGDRVIYLRTGERGTIVKRFSAYRKRRRGLYEVLVVQLDTPRLVPALCVAIGTTAARLAPLLDDATP